VGEVAVLRWSDVTNTDGRIKDEIRLLPDMTKGRHARTVFINAKLKAVLQAYADQARCADRSYPFFASQKSVKAGFSANSLAQTFALLYRSAGIEGASSHSGRRSFLTRLANQGTAIHLLKALAGHRSISTTAAYLYSNPTQLRAVVELV
jgi:integrase/recombinase XerD